MVKHEDNGRAKHSLKNDIRMRKKMEAKEIVWTEEDPIPNSTIIYPKGSKFTLMMKMGKVLPTTKEQVRLYVKNRLKLGLLNYADVWNIENIMQRHNLKGHYIYRGRDRVVLTNNSDFYKALQKEFQTA